MLLTSMSISSQNVFKTLLLFILTVYNKQTYDIFCICVELTASLLVAGLTHTHTHTHTHTSSSYFFIGLYPGFILMINLL